MIKYSSYNEIEWYKIIKGTDTETVKVPPIPKTTPTVPAKASRRSNEKKKEERERNKKLLYAKLTEICSPGDPKSKYRDQF